MDTRGEVARGRVALEERDYVAAHLAHAVDRRSIASIRQLALFAVAVTFVAVYAGWPVAPGVWCLMLAALLGVAALVPRQYVVQGRRAFAARHPARREVSYEIHAEGYRSVDPKAEMETSWQSFTGWAESEEAFILRAGDDLADFFPKRAFDEAGVASVRSLLESFAPATPEAGAPKTKRGCLQEAVIWVVLVILFTAINLLWRRGGW